MITIGIRASPKCITFAVYNAKTSTVVNVEEIRVPLAFATPEALKYIRNNILDVLREFSVEKAGIRVSEAFSKTLNIERIQIEGVIQEAFASSNLQAYYIGQISSISAKIGVPRADFKLFVDGTKDFDLDGWEDLNSAAREALLCAIGAEHA